MGNGVSFEREWVHSCKNAVGRIGESVGGDRCLPGGAQWGSEWSVQAHAGLGVGMPSRRMPPFASE
eukprot:914033-Prymnesium_polylepis.1